MWYVISFVIGLVIGGAGITIVYRNNQKHFSEIIRMTDAKDLSGLQKYVKAFKK